MRFAPKCVAISVFAFVWVCTSANAWAEETVTTGGKVSSVTVTKPNIEKDTTVGVIMLDGSLTPIRVKVGTRICVGDAGDLVGRSIQSIKSGQEIEVEGIVQGGAVTANQIIIRTVPKKP